MEFEKEFTELIVWGSIYFNLGDKEGQIGVSEQPESSKINPETYNKPKYCSFKILISQISCGEKHSGFISDQGYIYMMGCNEQGKLGIGDTFLKNSFSPLLVESIAR